MAQIAQLTFEPAYDAYHTMFRVGRILQAVEVPRLEYDKLRIVDFFLCFPVLVDQIRLRQTDRRFRSLVKLQRASYSGRPDGRLAFSRMMPTQAAAIQTIALAGYVRADRLNLGWVERTDKQLPEALLARILEENARDSLLMDFVKVLVSDFVLDGENGLKHRTALMEHRYDAV